MIFKPLALAYYRIALILPAEGSVEGFFSIGGFLYDSRRCSLSPENMKVVCLTYLRKSLEAWIILLHCCALMNMLAILILLTSLILVLWVVWLIWVLSTQNFAISLMSQRENVDHVCYKILGEKVSEKRWPGFMAKSRQRNVDLVP